MAEKEVKLFGMWASPFSLRVEWALKLKGVDYEYVNEDIPYNKSNELLRLNPVTKKVPVLVHAGKPIAESLVILEYVDEAWKEGYSIMPQDLFEAAQARFWAKFTDDKCNATVFPVFCTEGEAQQNALKEARDIFKTLEQALGDKKFFGGDQIGYLDLVIGWFAFWLPILEDIQGAVVVDEENAPLLKAWFTRFLDVELIKASLPPRDKIYELNKPRREQFLTKQSKP